MGGLASADAEVSTLSTLLRLVLSLPLVPRFPGRANVPVHEAVVLDELEVTEAGKALARLRLSKAGTLGQTWEGRVRLALLVAEGEEHTPEAEGRGSQLLLEHGNGQNGVASAEAHRLLLLSFDGFDQRIGALGHGPSGPVALGFPAVAVLRGDVDHLG